MAQQALQVLARPYKLPNRGEVKLSCSIGIAMFPEHGSTAKLIANADAAMYAAKRTGGSTYAFFEARMDLDVREQVEMQTDLRQALGAPPAQAVLPAQDPRRVGPGDRRRSADPLGPSGARR